VIYEKISLSNDGRVFMQAYIHDYLGDYQIQARPAIIILPGGAFYNIVGREAEPVALTFLAYGFNTFVLNYSVGEHSVYPNPLMDASLAVCAVRKNADKWRINHSAVTVMGFSAGASVAAMLATQWNSPILCDNPGITVGENRPDAVVLGYGSAYPAYHEDNPKVYRQGEVGQIAKDKPKELNAVNYVGPHTPPIFIYQLRYDRRIPVTDGMLLSLELYKHDIPFEMHTFQFGKHGMSVSNDLSSYKEGGDWRKDSVQLWPLLCKNWLFELFGL
jgi:acetyl esterase/lipase